MSSFQTPTDPAAHSPSYVRIPAPACSSSSSISSPHSSPRSSYTPGSEEEHGTRVPSDDPTNITIRKMPTSQLHASSEPLKAYPAKPPQALSEPLWLLNRQWVENLEACDDREKTVWRQVVQESRRTLDKSAGM